MTDTTPGAVPLIDKISEAIAKKLGSIQVTQGDLKIDLPLASVDIHSQVVDRIATVQVRQSFTNPYTEFLEAVYIFPLSGGIAVNHFEMKVKDRIVVGDVEERQEARRQYTQALQEGKRAALLEQERDDVFTMQLGNLPPGETIEITLKYAERLPYFIQGTTELRLPTVVASRYIPGEPSDTQTVGHGVEVDTALVPDASRITPPRLAKGVDSGVRLSITVDLAVDSTSSVSDLSCSQHATSTSIKPGWVTISLAHTDELLNRDFVLTWRLATSQEVRSRLFIYREKDQPDNAYGMLSIMPPRNNGFTGSHRDIVFVLDRSGSMQGIKMSSAIRACSILLETLTPNDRFSVAAFDNVCEWMGAAGEFYKADEDGLNRGHTFLRTIGARGGTEINSAIDAALQAVAHRDKPNSRIPIIVVITDGQIGDEARVLQSIQTKLGGNRVFTIGIDTAVNSGFLKRLAALGGGTCALVQPGGQLEQALMQIGREINAPLVTDIKISPAKKWNIQSTAPDPLPDLFQNRAVTAFFKIEGRGEQQLEVELKGKRADGKTFTEKVKGTAIDNEAIGQLWAKAYIMQLEDQFRAGGLEVEKLKKEIIELSKRHKLLTKFTAYVLVDHAEIVNKTGSHKTIVQPVCEPDSWEMTGGSFGGVTMPTRSLRGAYYGAAPAPMAPSQSPAPGTLAEAIRNKVSEFRNSSIPTGGSSSNIDSGSNWLGGAQPQGGSGPSVAGWGAPPGAPPPAAPRSRAFHSMRQASVGASPVIPDQSSLVQAYEKLSEALSVILKEIEAGKTPDAQSLSEAREEMLKALATSPIASEVPKMQKFLRVDLHELIAALRSNISGAGDVARLGTECKLALEDARREFEHKLKNGSAKINFWEASV
jgi:Ca-activated chloride channel homolog